jgi:hypothetical protein
MKKDGGRASIKSLRDYFAGQIKPAIIQGLMLRYKEQGYSDTYMLAEAHELTEEAVDAMIKERNKNE